MYPAFHWRRVALAIVVFSITARAEEYRTAGELGLRELPADQPVLVLYPDPAATPAEPIAGPIVEQGIGGLRMGSGPAAALDGLRVACTGEGFTTRAYWRDSGSDWPWLPANTLVADDLTLAPGNWIIDCYDVLIRADNSPAFGCNHSRSLTIRAYDACNGNLIPGSQETWTIPAVSANIQLTGVTNVRFSASGTIWFGMTTTADECDGWYLGQVQSVGSTTNIFQLDTDCAACINPPSCNPFSGFVVALFGCKAPTFTSQPANATICSGGFNQFCVNVQGSGAIQHQWQRDGANIDGATSPCYVATQAGSYRCVVTDSCTSATSDAATLTVRTGPVIGGDPTGGIACSGTPRHLCVSAGGIGTLHYQWKRGGLSIIGATSACYDATTAGSYSCVVSDDCGPATSGAAQVAAASPGTGDLDGNGAVNLADWEILSPCLAGPGAGLGAGCSCIDADADVDADLIEFARMQAGFGD